jgi:hypothetical protein
MASRPLVRFAIQTPLWKDIIVTLLAWLVVSVIKRVTFLKLLPLRTTPGRSDSIYHAAVAIGPY